MNRNVLIVGSVVLLHLVALWGMQTGLLQRAVELIVPMEVLTEVILPPVPVPPPPAPVPVTKPVPRSQPVAVPAQHQVPAPVPELLATPSPAPALPSAPIGVVNPAPPAPAVVATPAPATPPKLELPASDADYLNNPKPAYPALSKRMGEQGTVIVRALIGADGTAQKAELRQSSGYERLDQVALATVLKWRYIPGKRGGVAEAMWFNIPIKFSLD